MTKYRLAVTAGTEYGGEFRDVDINSESPIEFDTSVAKAQVWVRIRDYTKSCKYFEQHETSKFSIEIAVEFKQDVRGDSLLFGNDFATPIRDFLPYGATSLGLRVLKWVDPTVEGDLYTDKPYLYGKALGSFNKITVGEKPLAAESSESFKIPENDKERQTFFTNKEHLEHFVFRSGESYTFDFSNDYILLANDNFKLSLPGGFELDLSSYLQSFVTSKKEDAAVNWTMKLKDSERGEALDTGTPLLLVNFKLVEVK